MKNKIKFLPLFFILIMLFTGCESEEKNELLDGQKVLEENPFSAKNNNLIEKTGKNSANLWIPFIEDINGNPINQVYVNQTFYLRVDTTLCNCDWTPDTINVYLYQIDNETSNYLFYQTIGLNVTSPFSPFVPDRYEITLSSNVALQDYVIKITDPNNETNNFQFTDEFDLNPDPSEIIYFPLDEYEFVDGSDAQWSIQWNEENLSSSNVTIKAHIKNYSTNYIEQLSLNTTVSNSGSFSYNAGFDQTKTGEYRVELISSGNIVDEVSFYVYID